MWTVKTLIRLGGCPGWSESAGHTDHFVGFVMLRLICGCESEDLPMLKVFWRHFRNKWRTRTDITSRVTAHRTHGGNQWAATWQNQQNDLCTQRRLRSAWASTQSDQSLHCPHEETLGPKLTTERSTANTLIRLGGCPGWSEPLLGAHLFCWFCHVAAHILIFLYPKGTL